VFLKSLTLKGFKSFADTTVMDLEPGVTVVVGPNGSGKSNVVDAIAWVLGAQAPSAVRSQKMDDVIFAGTAKRAALGRAEVTLTLDNSSGLLPLDASEVVSVVFCFAPAKVNMRSMVFRADYSTFKISYPMRVWVVSNTSSSVRVKLTQF
jgi:predicted ATPase